MSENLFGALVKGFYRTGFRTEKRVKLEIVGRRGEILKGRLSGSDMRFHCQAIRRKDVKYPPPEKIRLKSRCNLHIVQKCKL